MFMAVTRNGMTLAVTDRISRLVPARYRHRSMSTPLRAAPRFHASSDRPSAAPPQRPLTLLVVDDDLLHARLLRANLSRPSSVRVEVVGSAPEALRRIAVGGVDAVVTDLVMPG